MLGAPLKTVQQWSVMSREPPAWQIPIFARELRRVENNPSVRAEKVAKVLRRAAAAAKREEEEE